MAGDRVRGAAGLRRFFDDAPAAVQTDLETTLQVIGYDILAAQQTDVAIRTGRVRGALEVKSVPRQLRVQIGLFKSRAWYGRIVEYGRRAQVVRAHRRRKNGRRLARDRASIAARKYTMRISALAPRPFVNKARPEIDQRVDARLAALWARVSTIGGSA